MKIIRFLQQPYPLEESKRGQLKTSFILSLVVFGFLVIVKPFGSRLSFVDFVINSAISALVVWAVIMLDLLVGFALFPRFFREEKWTTGRELILTLVIIITIAFAFMIINSIFWSFHFTLHSVFLAIIYTALVGMAPASASILLNQARLLRKYRSSAQTISQTLPPAAPTTPSQQNPDIITIVADNNKDSISFHPSDLFAITSADNYCKLYTRDAAKGITGTMLRITLKKAETSTTPFSQFWRCHRTAIVNMDIIEKVSGNAQGYRLHLANMSETIPVSRSLNAELRERLKNKDRLSTVAS
ncbi:MAG: LytTR family DNA-binding domain-containing protein [Chitinophagaceae bacterium]